MHPEEQAFREAMRRDPHDENTRLVYADWLDEHDKPQAAARLRWWVGAMKHLRTPETSGASVPTTEHLGGMESRMPEWVARLNQVHGVRDMLQGNAKAANHAGVADALHEAELHALGLHSADDFDFDLARFRAKNLRPLNAGGLFGYDAVNGVLRADAHHTHGYQPQQAAHAARDDVQTTANALHGPALERVRRTTQRLEEYMHRESPTKLALVGRALRAAREFFFSKPEQARALGDGVVHTSKDNPTGVFAERTAISHALRLRGDPSHSDPKQIEKYASAIARFVKANPEHAAVKKYAEAARMLGGTAGPELTEAVKPLVGAANMLLVAAGHDQPHVRPEAESKAAAFAHRSSAPEAAEPEKPAYEVVDDPAEPVQNMHTLVHGLLQQHKGDLNKTKAALKANHGLSHADAHAAVQKFLLMHTGMKGLQAYKRRAKSDPDAKLAAYKGGPVNPEHVAGEAYRKDDHKAKIDRHIADTALAFHTRLIAQKYPELAKIAERALASTTLTLPRGHGTDKEGGHWGELGRKLAGKPEANYFDWANLEKQIAQDKRVQDLVRQTVTHTARRAYRNESEKELGFWDGVHRKLASRDDFMGLIGQRSGLDANAIRESIARIRDRALDKAYTHNTENELEFHTPQKAEDEESKAYAKDKRKEITGEWRDTMGASHAK